MSNKIKRRTLSFLKKIKISLELKSFDAQLENTKLKKKGKIKLFNKPFHYHYGLAFYKTYLEIFKVKIYNFTTKNESPLIIDCGANMGLSILFFSKLYPDSIILAFEPDESVIPYIEKNIWLQELTNVKLIKKAVWKEEAELQFYTDEGLGGRIGNKYKGKSPKTISSVRLRNFLNKPVEMLKIDIEGSEYEVIKDCEDFLHNINHIFIEYHSCFDEEQYLDDLLMILKNKGFRYHLRESFSRNQPFTDKYLVCEKFDMTINIFAYKNL